MDALKIPILKYLDETFCSSGSSDYHETRAASLFRSSCPFCNRACKVLDACCNFDTAEQYDRAALCDRCGWWAFQCDQLGLSGEPYFYSAYAVLRKFSGSESSLTKAIEKHLVENREFLSAASLRELEESVTEFSRGIIGYRIPLSSYSRPDLGVDIVAIGRGEEYSAFRIKRSGGAVEIEVIRAFLGAILQPLQHRALFVTKLGDAKAEPAQPEGIEIDLAEGAEFLDFLGVLNRGNDPVQCPDWHKHGYMINYYR